MSPVVNPRPYNDNTISSMLDNRRCRLATITGSNEPSRSRGTSTATSPESVNTVFGRFPLRELPRFRGQAALTRTQSGKSADLFAMSEVKVHGRLPALLLIGYSVG